MAYGIESYDQSGSELVGMTLLPASREGVNYPTWSMYMHVPYPKKCFYFNMPNHHLSSDPRDSLPFWQFISQLLLQTAYLSLLKAGHNMFEAASVDAASLAAILPGLQRKWHHTFRVADARVQLEVRETLYHLSLSLSLSLCLCDYGGEATTSRNMQKIWFALSVLLSSWLAAKCLLAIESWTIPFAGL